MKLLDDVLSQVVEVKGVKLLATHVEGVGMNELRNLGDQLKEKNGRRRCCYCFYTGWQG